MSFQVTEVQRALKGADYPMSGEQLAKLAQRKGASQELVGELQTFSPEYVNVRWWRCVTTGGLVGVPVVSGCVWC